MVKKNLKKKEPKSDDESSIESISSVESLEDEKIVV